MTSRKKRRTFTEEFKKQMVQLYESGKRKSDILKEYDLSPSTLDKWIKQSVNTGSFKEKDNLTPDQKRILELEKKLKYADMEIDILKQAALIMGRK